WVFSDTSGGPVWWMAPSIGYGWTPACCSQAFTVSVANDPAQELSSLYDNVQAVGPGTSLRDKIVAAQSELAAGDTTGVCGVLTGFINELKAQTGRKVASPLATALVADAQTIRGALGCA